MFEWQSCWMEYLRDGGRTWENLEWQMLPDELNDLKVSNGVLGCLDTCHYPNENQFFNHHREPTKSIWVLNWGNSFHLGSNVLKSKHFEISLFLPSINFADKSLHICASWKSIGNNPHKWLPSSSEHLWSLRHVLALMLSSASVLLSLISHRISDTNSMLFLLLTPIVWRKTKVNSLVL